MTAPSSGSYWLDTESMCTTRRVKVLGVLKEFMVVYDYFDPFTQKFFKGDSAHCLTLKCFLKRFLPMKRPFTGDQLVCTKTGNKFIVIATYAEDRAWLIPLDNQKAPGYIEIVNEDFFLKYTEVK